MKIRTILSGITALLLVGSFYSFAFCMVEDVDDAPVSMDYYYSTETDAASGEQFGEATSAFDAFNDFDNAYAEYFFGEDGTNIVTQLNQEILSLPLNDNPATTQIPDSAAPSKEDTAAEPMVEEGLSDDEQNYAEADNQDVYAENSASDKLLSKLDDDTSEVTTVPEEQLTDDESDIAETVGTVADEEDDFELTDITTIAPVPAADVVITYLDTTYTTTETTITTTAPSGSDISTSETFTVKYGGSSHTVNSFDLICQIVNNEVSSYFNDEAIKAQAVAAYSYVKYHNANGLTPSVLVKSNPPQRIVDMVSSVWGKCCYYNGSVAQTVYMASSSGYTASACNVWGGSFAYLTSVSCPFDADNDPNYGVKTKFSENAVRTALESYLGITLSDNPENWLAVTGYIDGNYVSQVTVDGQKTISGRKLRENVLNYQLKSASFDVTYSDGYFVFTTYGWGHGVGMSQNGANILAKMGYTYDQILKYYFTGIDVL